MSIKIRQVTKERLKIQLIVFSLLILLSGSYFIEQSPKMFYFAKSSLFSWAADTRLINYHSYPITLHQISTVCKQLKPGDIILTRRNGFISNLFIPGYWTHSALYFGSGAEKFNISDPCVIEVISEGTVIRSLKESLQVNAFIILRPIIPKEDIDVAINNALNQIGKPYDYDFDFNTNDKISCTELIYHSYNHAKLIVEHEMFGKLFTTPDDIIQDFNNRKGSEDQRLKFVLYMDEKGIIRAIYNEPLAKVTFGRMEIYRWLPSNQLIHAL